MPVYDCGAPDCEECQRAFGPDRTEAIRDYHAKLAMVPCRVCHSPKNVYVIPKDRSQTICFECCPKVEHADGETGHVFEYERSERDHVCVHCGVLRSCTDYQHEPMEGDVPLFGLIEPGEPVGTPISEISTTPGKPGYANWLRISQSWGH